MYVCIHELQDVELVQNKKCLFPEKINIMNFILINMQIVIK